MKIMKTVAKIEEINLLYINVAKNIKIEKIIEKVETGFKKFNLNLKFKKSRPFWEADRDLGFERR